MAHLDAFRHFLLSGVQVTENELGHGSYAVVLELKYRGLKCAGKKLYRVLYESAIGHAAQRYLEECRLLSQMRHPHIVQFIGVFFEEGSQFPILVMEFLPTNLSSCLDRYSILSGEISYSILHDVSLGLSYLHDQTPPIVHRDLSANNVLLSKDITAKISDLGVARILNLTPLQVSRMTETPGTPAYMPPEVMVADPRYDTSVDVFSFGVMMIHTFIAEWPLPKIGPTRVDPADPDQVIGVTEAERREEFLRKIAQDHPLMDLIIRCLNNNPQRRPRADEIVCRMGDVVLQYPPSFENRVEMLQRISTLDTEKRGLEQEIVRKVATIEEKIAEIEQLGREKKRQQEESDSKLDQFKFVSSIEADYEAVETSHLRGQLEAHQTLVAELRAINKGLTTELEERITNTQKEVDSCRSREATLASKLGALVAQNESALAEKDTLLSSKDAIIVSKDAVISSKEAEIAAQAGFLRINESTIQSMGTQLQKTREYLTSKPQPLQAQLSYTECSEAPVNMYLGTAVVVSDKVYYGAGLCELDEDEYFVHCYKSSQDIWATLPKLPFRHFGMGKVNNELVTVGGRKGLTRINTIYVFSKGRNWKQTIPPMPTARGAPAVISLPTHLIVAGGRLSSGQPTDIVESYNISTTQWSKTDCRLPYKCIGPRVAAHNNKVCLMGGRGEFEQHLNKVISAQADHLIFNLAPADQCVWKEVMNTPSFRPSPVVVSSDIVLAVGGTTSVMDIKYSPKQEVYAYSSSMNSWVYVGDLPSPRTWAATVSLSPTEFLVIGGQDEQFNALNPVCKATINVSLK